MAMLLAVISAVGVTAQTDKGSFTVKGCVVDSLTKEGEAYATVRITNSRDTVKPVRMAVTQGNGRFTVKLPSEGGYTLTVSAVGRKSIVRDFKADAAGGTLDLGQMLISDGGNSLEGVEVVAQKPLVKADIDKLEYNIEEDPDSKTSSVIEMLRKVPLVTVDGQDNIKVNGSSNFKVYVNGKPNNMMSKNPKEVLKSMPASTIKRIEVITNPGPKYDAEGVGGILNIITTGSGMEGYTTTVTAGVGNSDFQGSAFATVKTGKLTVSANYSYFGYYNQKSEVESLLTPTDASDPTAAAIDNSGKSRSHGDFNQGSLEASYEIDSLRLLTASVSAYGGNYKYDMSNSVVASSPLSGSMLYRYNMPGKSDGSWMMLDGSIDYQRTFSVKGRMLTLSYKISTSPSNSDSRSEYNDFAAIPDWQDFLSRLDNQHVKGDGNTQEHTFQADYTTPLGKLHTVEMGAKYIIRNNKSNSDRYIRPTDNSQDYDFDDRNSSHYKHDNDILAAYFGYGLKLNKISARLGMRYEHTFQNVKYLLGRGDNFRKEYDDFVPSASLGYKFSDQTNIRLGYNMRIYRPGIDFLNPYIDDSNPTNISQGNSHLDTEKSHSVDLGLNHFTPKVSLNLSLRYAFTDNSIESYSSLVNDETISGLENPTGKQVLYTTYKNIGSNRSLGVSGYFSWTITNDLRWYSNFSGSYQHYSDGIDQKNHGWFGSLYTGLEQSFRHDWRIGVQFYGQTPWVSLQGKDNPFVSYAVSVNKQMCKQRLTISAYASNFMQLYSPLYKSRTETSAFRKEAWNRWTQMRIGISVSYRFGELKASVKKAERTIDNDDVKGGDKKGGGER